jgi:hypothetical protein
MDLGQRLGRFSTDKIYLLLQFAVYGGFVFILWAALADKLGLPHWWYLPVWIGTYVLAVILLDRIRPHFHVYEDGVVVIQNQKRDFWRWDELSHYDGTRTHTSVNGIPVARTGANHFYTRKGDTAFSVGALTGSANVLVNYIIMKWVQQRSDGDIQRLNTEASALTFGTITLDKTGLSSPKYEVSWSAIEAIHFKYRWALDNAQVIVTIKSDGYKAKLGYLEGVALYSFMALVDSILHTDYLTQAQRELIRTEIRLMRQTRFVAQASALISAIIFALLALALVIALGQTIMRR